MRLPKSALLASLLLAGTGAHATCPVTIAGYGGGAFGTEAVAGPGGCFRTVFGGAGVTSAADASGGMSASANLATGVITAYSDAGIASSSLWDTVTFSGLPAAGGAVTEVLHLSGSMVDKSFGFADLDVGTGALGDFSSLGSQNFLITSTDFPSEVSLSFWAHNGVPVLLLAALSADPVDGIADLRDPPTFSLELDPGVTFTSASGVLDSVGSVPEPASLACMLLGLGLLGAAGKRRAR
jgi:hypothetical protein